MRLCIGILGRHRPVPWYLQGVATSCPDLANVLCCHAGLLSGRLTAAIQHHSHHPDAVVCVFLQSNACFEPHHATSSLYRWRCCQPAFGRPGRLHLLARPVQQHHHDTTPCRQVPVQPQPDLSRHGNICLTACDPASLSQIKPSGVSGSLRVQDDGQSSTSGYSSSNSWNAYHWMPVQGSQYRTRSRPTCQHGW